MTAIGEPTRILEIPDPVPASNPSTPVPDYVPDDWPSSEPQKETPAIPATP